MNSTTKRTTYYRIIEFVTLSGLLYAWIPLFMYTKLPENPMVPLHFDISGHPDRWGDKKSLIVYSLLAVFFYILLSVLERNPKSLNYPVKVTPGNSNAIYLLGVNLVRHLKLFVVLLFATLANISYCMAMGKIHADNQYLILLPICGLLISLVVFAIKMVKLKD